MLICFVYIFELTNVLIDTWWNVNLCLRNTKTLYNRFNRYMVECE